MCFGIIETTNLLPEYLCHILLCYVFHAFNFSLLNQSWQGYHNIFSMYFRSYIVLVLGKGDSNLRLECRELEEMANYRQVNSPGMFIFQAIISNMICKVAKKTGVSS